MLWACGYDPELYFPAGLTWQQRSQLLLLHSHEVHAVQQLTAAKGCRTEEIKDSDIGTRAGLFEVVKIGDEFYSFIVDCEEPKACTVLLRGASKDVLNEVPLCSHKKQPFYSHEKQSHEHLAPHKCTRGCSQRGP